MAKYKHVCKQCKIEFEDYFKNTKFCSRICYETYRKENGKCKIVECPICKKTFHQKTKNQIFCSNKCKFKYHENKEKCICEYCNTEFYRKASEVLKNKHHYCSNECRIKAMYWSDDDCNILKEYYGKIKNSELLEKFNGRKTLVEIKRKAQNMNITKSRLWKTEEINILKEYYSILPLNEILEKLPNRTMCSILHKARELNIFSYYYIESRYTKEENDYLKSNYLYMSNEELSVKLHRSEIGIQLHLYSLGCYRPTETIKYKNLSDYIRCNIKTWVNIKKYECNFTCAITGCRSNIVLHHIRSFNLLLEESLMTLDFPLYNTIEEYSSEQLDLLLQTFFDIQDNYNSYICITENIHKHFHSIYGYGNNTKEQWVEYIDMYHKKLENVI